MERLETLYRKLSAEERQETDAGRKEILNRVKNNIANIYVKQEIAFRAAYNGRVFQEQNEDEKF